MKRIIISLTSLATLLLLSTFVLAQTGGTIKGKLVDKVTGEPVPFANVYIKYGEQIIGTESDADGYYTIKPVPTGIYTIYVSAVGWGDVNLTDVKVFDETTTFVDDIAMVNGIDIPPVVISSAKLIEPGAPSSVKLTSKEIKNIPNNTNVNGIIKVMTSEILVNEERDEIYFRGSRSGDANYYIDGVRVDGSLAEYPSMAIGSIMVYTGGVPAKYGDFTGGVVVIETMSYFDWLAQKESERLRNGGN